jgi:thymidylate synthase (FAD)
MTHQLVRHRLCAFSQQSQRFVDEESFSYVVPENIAAEYVEEFQRDMETIQQMYRKWRHKGLRKEDARFVLPNACASEIVISANFRQWRHIFCVRCSRHAQWEIRAAALEMLRIMKGHAPAVFEDFLVNDGLMTACTTFDS